MVASQNSWSERYTIFPGYRPISWYNRETGEMEGDAWWQGGIPTQNTTEFIPYGKAEGTKIVEFYMPHWKKTKNALGSTSSSYLTSNVLGTYTDTDGVQEDLIVGVRMWEDNNGTDYRKSIEKKNGSYVYGSIHRDYTSEPWVIGDYESPDGWYEGAEPDVENPVTFTFTTNSINDLNTTIYGLFTHSYNWRYSDVYYDSKTKTFRISVPTVTASVGWLECTDAK